MKMGLGGRKLVTAAAALIALGHTAAASAQSSDEVEVYAYDAYIEEFKDTPPTIPASLRRDIHLSYDVHKGVWGKPPIETFYKNKPVIFLSNDRGQAAASTGNYVPYRLLEFGSKTNKLRAIIKDTSIATKEVICNNILQENWCSPDHETVYARENAIKIHGWKVPLLLSHEFIHLWQKNGYGVREKKPHHIGCMKALPMGGVMV